MSAKSARRHALFGQEPGIIPWTLLGFILLSACVHAFGFYLFQAIYPPAAHIGPPPVQVSLLAPGTPEADAILHWIDSEDPALSVEPARAPIPGLMTLPYFPSYGKAHARPVMARSAESPLLYPDGASGLDLVKLAASHPTPAPPGPAPAATALTFSGPLKAASVDRMPLFDRLHEADLGELQPARFLIGVTGTGAVQYVFIQDSSGDKPLDATAGTLLQQVRFHPMSAPLTWGFATFDWGSAVYARPTPAPDAMP